MDGRDTSELVVELELVRTRVAQLEHALASRITIEQAKGILRERFGWSIEDAFAVLRLAARSARRPTGAAGTPRLRDRPSRRSAPDEAADAALNPRPLVSGRNAAGTWCA